MPGFFLLYTFILSAVASIITFLSYGTEEWVVSNPKWSLPEITTINKVHYGLFSGTLIRNLNGSNSVHPISMTCDFGENVCAMLCGTETEREEQLDKLIKRESVSFNPSCGSNSKMFEPSPKIVPTTREAPEPTFINAGVWVSTAVFLFLAGFFGVVSVVLSLWNAVGCPNNLALNLYVLLVLNAIAAISTSLVLCLWIIHMSLIKNVGVLETITGQMISEEVAPFGYSYWMNWISWSCYMANTSLINRAINHLAR